MESAPPFWFTQFRSAEECFQQVATRTSNMRDDLPFVHTVHNGGTAKTFNTTLS
jgi:hypothetical protein